MQFEPSQDQALLRDAAERFAREHLASPQTGQWRRFAELGWLALPLAEDAGGLGGTTADVAVLMEALGGGLVREPYLATVLLAGRLLDAAGTSDLRAQLLPRVVNGEMRLGFAHHEPQMRFALSGVQSTASPSDSKWLLSGRKALVLDGGDADRLVVSARIDGRGPLALFLVEPGMEGVKVRPYRTLDGGWAADFEFDRVALDAAHLVAADDQVEATIERVVDQAICAICAEAVGAMRKVCEITRDYIGTRRQFGVAIGTQQVVRHRWVDMHIATEEAKSITQMAATAADGDADERRALASAAKAKVAEAGRFVGEQGIQLHGAIGMTDDYLIGHFYKRLVVIGTLFGDADYYARRLAGAAGSQAWRPMSGPGRED